MSDYFTRDEQVLVADTPLADRFAVVALLWSAKESALKALQTGLRLDTRSVAVHGIGWRSVDDWTSLHARSTQGESFQGWWREASGMVRTLVADPLPAQPVHLRIPSLVRSSSWHRAPTTG